MEILKVELHSDDLERFAKISHSYSTLREPRLQLGDILTNRLGKYRGGRNYVYSFKTFRDDWHYLTRIAQDLVWDRMSPDEQTVILLNPKDGYVPPPLRAPGQ
jgi:hypothetical protein